MAQGMNIQELKTGLASQGNVVSAQQRMQAAQAKEDFLAAIKSNLSMLNVKSDLNGKLAEISMDQREGIRATSPERR
jgi:hypothetical protein